jgi:hypothetical protein
MEFPLENWEIFHASDFNQASVRDPGELGMESLIQVRSTGRMLDHFQVLIGGSSCLKLNIPLKEVLLLNEPADAVLLYEVWPRDILIRRNMTTSAWFDLKELVAANEITVTAQASSSNPNQSLVAKMEESKVGGAIRWAACVAASGRMELQAQFLPAPAATLAGKPTLNG